MALVVDTSVIIGFLRGAEPDKSCFESILRSGEGVITSITVFELAVGFYPESERQQIGQKLIEVLDVIPFDQETALKAGAVERTLRQRGETIGTRDVFIAGICLVHKLPIVTGNVEHFKRVPNLQVITPQVISS